MGLEKSCIFSNCATLKRWSFTHFVFF